MLMYDSAKITIIFELRKQQCIAWTKTRGRQMALLDDLPPAAFAIESCRVCNRVLPRLHYRNITATLPQTLPQMSKKWERRRFLK